MGHMECEYRVVCSVVCGIQQRMCSDVCLEIHSKLHRCMYVICACTSLAVNDCVCVDTHS
jgi:hypothetical protein